MKTICQLLFYSGTAFLLSFPAISSTLWAQEKPEGPPPVKVIVSEVSTGMVAPQSEFIGTIYYQEVSDVAAEVSGLVEIVQFEEGQRVNQDQILVKLNPDILKKKIRATEATHEQVLTELQQARRDLNRKEKLFKNKSISEQAYDENLFEVKRFEKQAESLMAEVERLELELEKAVIRAPFKGVVVKRHVDRGEWISEGDAVAIIAKDDVVDVVVNLPERYIGYIEQGLPVNVTVGEKELSGKVIAIVPKGDIATRTFPVKVRMPNKLTLIEGMTAKVNLPTGKKDKTLIVPRDAVMNMFGQTVVFTVVDSKARMIPVRVIGYQGLTTGVIAEELKDGMEVVVKGNERLRDGQVVLVEKLG